MKLYENNSRGRSLNRRVGGLNYAEYTPSEFKIRARGLTEWKEAVKMTWQVVNLIGRRKWK